MKATKILFLFLLITISNLLCGQGFNPGKERWPVKTSIKEFLPVIEVDLRELLNLPVPIRTYSKDARKKYQDQRFPETVGTLQLKEGDIVTTTGYILLVALEKDKNGSDADYHIQMRTTSDWTDSCLVIEATYPPFINGNSALQDSCRKVRDFFDRYILKSRKKACFGNNGIPATYVKITGQLFFDAFHVNTPPRGKQNTAKEKIKSYSCWEIHPITSISFIKE